jgi:hypothetical protein
MDSLRRDSIERAIRASPEEKARQALEMMRAAIRLYRAGLRTRYPDATADEIETRLREWLLRDE